MFMFLQLPITPKRLDAAGLLINLYRDINNNDVETPSVSGLLQLMLNDVITDTCMSFTGDLNYPCSQH